MRRKVDPQSSIIRIAGSMKCDVANHQGSFCKYQNPPPYWLSRASWFAEKS